MPYKRNQIEEAIGRIFHPDSAKPVSELLTRLKRLLELDRALGRKHRSQDPEQADFAFFSEEGPGTGADILFSEYEASALLNGLRMMQHGWPQSSAVSIMRRVRPDLQKEHARILRQRPEQLFDEKVIRAKARPGDIAVDNTDPVFIAIASKSQRGPNEEQIRPACSVCHGFVKVSQFVREVGASSWTLFEVATITHKLREELIKTKPRRRGRAGGFSSPSPGPI